MATIDGPQANDTLAYSYDQLGRIVSRTLNGTGVTWTFDALGRTTSAVNPLGTFTYTYDGLTSRIATATYPNGQTSTYSYFGGTDDRRLQTIHHKTPGTATLSKFDYTYDAVGNIKTWTQQADATAPVQWAYCYDAANQLISAVKASTGATPAILARFAYRYDTAGNRTEEQIDDALMGATHNASNQLTSQQPAGVLKVAGQLSEAATVTIDGQPATVDATNRFTGTKTIAAGGNVMTVVARDGAGNTTSQTYDLASSGAAKAFTYDSNGNLISDGTRTFEWDAEDRLLAVNHGTKRSEFSYDGESRRVRIVEKESGATVRDARLFWAGTAIIEERLSTGQVSRFFGDSEQHNGAARYVTRDHLGSVREVTDASGAVVTRNDYDPYGRLVRVGGTEDSRFGFTGHYTHSPTSLALTLYRAYDPNAGRWLSTDPIREAGGVNLFAYSGNNPINFVDPLGLSWQTFVEGLQKGAVTGLAIAAVLAMLPAAVLSSPIVATIGAALGVASVVMLIATLVYLYLNDCQDQIDRILGELVGSFGGGLVGAAIGRAIRGLVSAAASLPVFSSSPVVRVIPQRGPALLDSYWKGREAPVQVTPGIRRTTDMKPSSRSRGETYERTSHYDQYGRLVGQTHKTSHGEPSVHPSPHHHIRNPSTGQVSGPLPGLHPDY